MAQDIFYHLPLTTYHLKTHKKSTKIAVIYKGALPDDLMAAYSKLDDLDDTAPRRKFLDIREKTGGIFNYFIKKRQERLERRALKKAEKEKEATLKKGN